MKESGKKYSEKAFIRVNSPFFCPCFLKEIQYEQIPKDKKIFLLRDILSSNFTVNLLINFVSFVLSVFLLYFMKYLCLCKVCKEQINAIKKITIMNGFVVREYVYREFSWLPILNNWYFGHVSGKPW